MARRYPEEVGRRGGLKTALAGRDAATLAPVLKFIARHVSQPRHTWQLLGVLARILDIYGGEVGASPAVDGALRLIRERVAAELRLQDDLSALSGVAAPLLAAGQHAAAAATAAATGAYR